MDRVLGFRSAKAPWKGTLIFMGREGRDGGAAPGGGRHGALVTDRVQIRTCHYYVHNMTIDYMACTNNGILVHCTHMSFSSIPSAHFRFPQKAEVCPGSSRKGKEV